MYIKRFVKHYYIMLIPALLWLFFFSIVPMFGIVMAFQDYNPGMGILHSKFVGLENFKYMFQMNDVKQVLCNTVVIAPTHLGLCTLDNGCNGTISICIRMHTINATKCIHKACKSPNIPIIKYVNTFKLINGMYCEIKRKSS